MTKRIVQLDGMRGIAALVVVIAHYFGETAAGLESLKIGWLGVEVFFVLSGFLIGGIVFDEIGKPGFWRSFYVRRTARIIPLYLVTVAFVCALGAGVSPIAYLTFTHNFVFAAQGFDAVYTHPLWTLAVEEQFYLLLPALIAFTPKRFVLPALVALFLAAPAFRLAMVALNQPMAANVLLFGRMDMLVAGVIGAWALRNLDLKPHLRALRCAPIPLLFSASAIHFGLGFDAFVIFGQGLIALGVAAFIVSTALGAPEFKAPLSAPLLGFFGTISYALYLLHQPINTLLHRVAFDAAPDVATLAQIGVTGLAVAVTIGVSYLSWLVIEKPSIAAGRAFLAGQYTWRESVDRTYKAV